MDSLAGRGRARGRAMITTEQCTRVLLEARKPKEAPLIVQAMLMAGRGHGLAPEEVPVKGGRSKPRIAHSVPHVGLAVGMGAMSISSSAFDTGS